MINKPRYILIGTGGMGRIWCSKIIPGVDFAKMVAAVDINKDALENPSKYLNFPREKCYTSARKAFDENKADFIIVVTPPAFREEIVDMAIEYGLHIFSEKPMAESMETCCRIYHKVKKAGIKLAVNMTHRFERDKQTLEHLINSNQYGPLNYLVSRLTKQRPKEHRNTKPGHTRGASQFVSEAVIHNLDTLRSMSKSNAKSVYAQTWNPEYHNSMSGFYTVEMENGVRGLCEVSFNNATTLNDWSKEYYRAECRDATLELDNFELSARSHQGYPNPECSKIGLMEQDCWGHKWLMKMFVQWIKGERDNHPTSLEDNMQCNALTYAALESAQTGQAVDVQRFLKDSMDKYI